MTENSGGITEEEISANRMQWVENEVMDFRRGFIDKLRCPYCTSLNRQDQEFCCPKFEMAVAAVCDKLDQIDRKNHAESIAEKVN